jgi:hypothetical protein
MSFIVGCKKTFQNFIKKMPKKDRCNYHHVTQKEWDDFIAKINIPVTLTMKQKDDIKIEKGTIKNNKERCD